jgi:hypothetical protein
MAAVLYNDSRIEIQPFPIPGGWSAEVQVWSFASGTTRVVPLAFPLHIAFPTQAGAQAYAEKLAHRWGEQQRSEQPRTARSGLTPEEQRRRAAAYGDLIEGPKSKEPRSKLRGIHENNSNCNGCLCNCL